MTFLLPSFQLHQIADLLRCCEQTGATITGEQAVRAAEHMERLATAVAKLETFAAEVERDEFDAVFGDLMRPPAPEGAAA